MKKRWARVFLPLVLLALGAALYGLLPLKPRWSLQGQGHILLGFRGQSVLTCRQHVEAEKGPIEQWDLATGELLKSYLSSDESFLLANVWGARDRLTWTTPRAVHILDLADSSHTRLALPDGTGFLQAWLSEDHNLLAVALDNPAQQKLDGFLVVDVAAAKIAQRWGADCRWRGFCAGGVVYSEGSKLVTADPRTGVVKATLVKPGWFIAPSLELGELEIIAGRKPSPPPADPEKSISFETLPPGEVLMARAQRRNTQQFQLYRLPSLEPLATVNPPVERGLLDLSVSPDRRWGLGTTGEGAPELWDLAKQQRIAERPEFTATSVLGFTPDSRAVLLCWGNVDRSGNYLTREVVCLEIPSLAPRWRQVRSQAFVWHAEWHSSGKWVALPADVEPGLEGIELLDLATGALIARCNADSPYWQGHHLIALGRPRQIAPWQEWLEKLGIRWARHPWVHAVDATTGSEVASVPTWGSLGDPRLSPDEDALVCELPPDYSGLRGLAVWDLPPRRRWAWIMGIPAGLGLVWYAWSGRRKS